MDKFRAIIDRKTRQIVGDIVPAPDHPIEKVADSEILFRYINEEKFIRMLKSSCLYFARGDRFEDPYEGRHSLGNDAQISMSDQNFNEAYGLSTDLERCREKYEQQRKYVAISCWSLDENESLYMWKEFHSCVAIVTTVGKLRKYIPQQKSQMGGVTYQDITHPRSHFEYPAIFFYKPPQYIREREFRILIYPEQRCTEFPIITKINVPLREVIDRVIVHPSATDSFKEEIQRLLDQYLTGITCESSSLSSSV